MVTSTCNAIQRFLLLRSAAGGKRPSRRGELGVRTSFLSYGVVYLQRPGNYTRFSGILRAVEKGVATSFVVLIWGWDRDGEFAPDERGGATDSTQYFVTVQSVPDSAPSARIDRSSLPSPFSRPHSILLGERTTGTWRHHLVDGAVHLTTPLLLTLPVRSASTKKSLQTLPMLPISLAGGETPDAES